MRNKVQGRHHPRIKMRRLCLPTLVPHRSRGVSLLREGGFWRERGWGDWMETGCVEGGGGIITVGHIPCCTCCCGFCGCCGCIPIPPPIPLDPSLCIFFSRLAPSINSSHTNFIAINEGFIRGPQQHLSTKSINTWLRQGHADAERCKRLCLSSEVSAIRRGL
jgi:hypothetical protein